jgi:hypothetical protein
LQNHTLGEVVVDVQNLTLFFSGVALGDIKQSKNQSNSTIPW